jgi:hypothetical protein
VLGRSLAALLALFTVACDAEERSESFPITVEGFESVDAQGESSDAVCEPGVVSVLVGVSDTHTAVAGECFEDVECYAHDYDGSVEVVCFFVGCADPAYEALPSGSVVELSLENPCE